MLWIALCVATSGAVPLDTPAQAWPYRYPHLLDDMEHPGAEAYALWHAVEAAGCMAGEEVSEGLTDYGWSYQSYGYVETIYIDCNIGSDGFYALGEVRHGSTGYTDHLYDYSTSWSGWRVSVDADLGGLNDCFGFEIEIGDYTDSDWYRDGIDDHYTDVSYDGARAEMERSDGTVERWHVSEQATREDVRGAYFWVDEDVVTTLEVDGQSISAGTEESVLDTSLDIGETRWVTGTFVVSLIGPLYWTDYLYNHGYASATHGLAFVEDGAGWRVISRAGWRELTPGADGDGDGWPGSIDPDDADAGTGFGDVCQEDLDGDTYGAGAFVRGYCPAGYTWFGGDCDDADPAVHPFADADHDCADVDADGDGAADWSFGGLDCDDADGDVHVGSPELEDGLDNDCDGGIDEGFASIDLDDDGFATDDCDDNDPDMSPKTEERCDGVDNNCNGLVDETSIESTRWYGDADGDGFGFTEIIADTEFHQSSRTPFSLGCVQPAGTAAVSGDCDDGDPARSPGTAEIADGIDQDCDGTTDEETEVYDDDGDGYAELAGDCDDGDFSRSPAAAERCDGGDNDCDGLIDEDPTPEVCNRADDDCDGQIDEDATEEICNGLDDDCDGRIDENAVEEICNGLDDDCDGVIDDPLRLDCDTGSPDTGTSAPRPAPLDHSFASSDLPARPGPETCGCAAAPAPALSLLLLLPLLTRRR